MGGSRGSWQRFQMAAAMSALCFPIACLALPQADPPKTPVDAAVVENSENQKTTAPAAALSAGPGTDINTQGENRTDLPDELPKVRNNAIAAALADGVTTKLVLSAGALEANPLALSSPLGLAALTGAKVLLVVYAEKLPEQEKRLVIKTTSAAWGGAAINNLMVLVAAPPPIPIVAGILMGIFAWKQTAREYEDGDRLAAQQKATLPSAPVQASLEPALTAAP